MVVSRFDSWTRDLGIRLRGSRPLDRDKLQAPCITRDPCGRYRLFYTAVGPAKPFSKCQGYILSAVSEDGLDFHKEEGIRIAPQPELRHISRRVLVPSVTRCADGRWRMYFEARGPAEEPTVICSAISEDMLNWHYEEGIRFQTFGSLGGPRFLPLGDGCGRLYCWAKEETGNAVVRAITSDGLNFQIEPSCRFAQERTEFDSLGVTAAEVILPTESDDNYTMVYSEWQNVPPGTKVPVHPCNDTDADGAGSSENFAAASIASDIAGYRSRIYTATSRDGLLWNRGTCIIDGAGYGREGVDAVHAEDMSLIRLDDGRYRMYYAACDTDGNWCVASAVTTT